MSLKIIQFNFLPNKLSNAKVKCQKLLSCLKRKGGKKHLLWLPRISPFPSDEDKSLGFTPTFLFLYKGIGGYKLNNSRSIFVKLYIGQNSLVGCEIIIKQMRPFLYNNLYLLIFAMSTRLKRTYILTHTHTIV